MQMKQSHRILAAALALVMVLGLLPTSAFAKAAGNDGSVEMNEPYAAHESLMPIGPSFNVDTLLEWTPESDPDAAYSKASIPLADRVGGFVVNPLVNPEAKLMLCSLANSDHDHTSAQGTESFLSYAFNYWQYTGSFVYWSGSEEGLICCPTGEFTDAAHTNGVPVVATLGFPWGSGSGYVEQVRKFVQKAEDGSFPVADKLIEVMDYYGFDGYFFNQESYGCSATEGALIDEMMRYMHKLRPDMLISWYDSMLPTGGVSYQNAVTSSNKQFMTDSEDGTRAIDEFFMNYSWYESQINTTISTMKSIGRSQFDAFAGIDVQQNCMDTAFRDYLLVDEDGMTRLSLALYCPNSTLGLATSGENFHEVEQVFYTNAKGDPRDTSVDLNTSNWAGMSRFFADHTVIIRAPFVTNFNSGHGRGYYVDGVLSRDSEWSYQSNQDVMPTWTWIIDSEGQKLEGGYDFTDAYNGGNSIMFAGSLTAGKANDIMLYSTQVAVESGMKLGLTYKNDGGLMKLVAYYGDANTASYEDCTKVEYPLTAGEADTWTTTGADLSADAGKILYAIGLKVESSEDVANYQVNLGRLTLTEKTRAALSGPSTITLDEIMYKDAYTAEARVYWNAVTGASSYEIYKVHEDGTKSLIMETPSTAFYIPTLTRDADETDVTLEVVALNRNGVRGKGSTMTIDWAYGNDDSEKITKVDFENVCLNAEVTDVSFENSGEPAVKALDGTAANNSKWCATNQTTGYMCIDIGREVTVKRWRVEHGEYGGEDKATNTKDFSLEYKDASGNWVEAMRIQNNTLAVTDVLLDEPVTAQEWKLRVYDDGDSPWVAIRIYEWQMFETDQFPQTDPVPMHFASAVNNAGATDTFTLQNVANGQTVKVYTKSADGYTLIGEQTAAEAGTVTLSGLDFGTAEAGRVYYTTTEMAAEESVKLSAPFEAETAEKSAPAENVTFAAYSRAGSVSSSNGDDIYTTLTVKDLTPGDVIYVYENGADAGYTKASLPVAAGETAVSVDGIRVVRAGGTLALQVKRNGKLISDVYAVNTPAFAEPTATLQLFAQNEAGETLTGVRYGIYGEDGEKLMDISTTSDSGGKAEVPLGTYTLKCESVPEGYSPNREQVVRIVGIEGWTYTVTVSIPSYADPAVSGVEITPADAVVMPGETADFQAAVTGVGAYSEDVTWTLSGAKSEETTLSADGKLTVGADETAYYLTVTATSVQDGKTCDSVNVILGVLTNVAKHAQVFIYNGGLQGQDNGPEKLVDGDLTTKWQETMVADDGFLLAGLYLGQYYDVYSVKLYHAGSAGEDAALNTANFYLRSVNEDQTFDTDFWLSYGVADSAYYVGRNPNYYVEHAAYTSNTENVTTLSLEQAIHVQSMLVHVETPNADTDDDVRLYELEVLAVDTDQVAARRVMALIDAIGEVTDESGEAITAAREGYDALTDAQKTFVENYQTLLDAENAFGSLGDCVEKLQAYYDALIAENTYSSANQKKLDDLLAEGLAALESSWGQEAEALLNQYIAAMDEVLTFEEEMEAAKAAAEAAQKAAEEAQKKAEDAQAAAEAAQKAAEEAAASTAEDKAAAEKAAEEAKAAQEEAEAAKAAAEEAQKAAEAAAAAAEASNLAAAEEARKAAEDAAKSASSAAEAAESARQAAEAQKGAQEARQAAEEAQAAAEEAQKKAEEARKAAEEAAASAAEDKEAAEKAQAEAEAAQAAAEASQKAAEEAEAAAQAAAEAAAEHDAAAAAAAAEAAEYAKKVAQKYEEICGMKAQMAEYLLDAQKSAEEAEAAKKAAEEAELACAKYYALYTLSTYADKGAYAPAQQAELAAAIKAGREAISAAGTVADVDKALADAKAAIDAIKTLEDLKLNFTDVKESDWFYEAVQFTVNEGLFKGVSDTTFAPNGKMNRAMLVTTLYRLANEPEVTGTTKFTDVDEEAYYYNALLWASANGIVKGVTDTTFGPGALVTREQMVTFLYRYALLEGKDVTARADLSGYADAGKISSFAADPMSWAVAAGLIKGVDATTLAPKGTATRAQVATILMRFVENN